MPLTAVVTVREQQEQAALRIYLAATREAENARRRLQGLALEIQSAATEFQQRVVRGCTARDLLQLENHCERLQIRRLECERAIALADEAVKKAISCWHAARQAREVVEEHILRLQLEGERRARRKEQKMVDDLAAARRNWQERVSERRVTA